MNSSSASSPDASHSWASAGAASPPGYLGVGVGETIQHPSGRREKPTHWSHGEGQTTRKAENGRGKARALPSGKKPFAARARNVRKRPPTVCACVVRVRARVCPIHVVRGRGVSGRVHSWILLKGWLVRTWLRGDASIFYLCGGEKRKMAKCEN